MARIYIARTTGIGAFERHVVLKMILPERAADKHSVDMFLDEARLAAALNHQNVAQVFEVGQEGGVHFLAMEYVHGQDLRAVLAKAGQTGARIPIELALAIVVGAAAGLHHAHDRRSPDGVPLGIVHRDVSPSNIMIGYDGAVKLLDFGIAKATSRSVETQSGIIKGKFAYMSPEQCRGREVDRRSDVFSLGINLYEITTQHRCFRAESDFDTMHRIVTGDVVRPSRLVASYSPELERIVMTALAVDPERRFASCAAMLEEVENFAARARLSPSTMALGRFMRELFGEVPEPWQAGGRANSSSPPPQRENTVSNTLDSHAHFSAAHEDSERSQQHQGGESIIEWGGMERAGIVPGGDDGSWAAKERSAAGNTWAAKPASRARAAAPGGGASSQASANDSAAQTLLDLPRGGEEAEDAVDWDAKAYPQAQPTFASQLELAVEPVPSMHGRAKPSSPDDRSGPVSRVATNPRIRRGYSPPRAASNSGSATSSSPSASTVDTTTAPAAAAVAVRTNAFSVAAPATRGLRAGSIAMNLRPRQRLLVAAVVAFLVAAFAALLVITWGGTEVTGPSSDRGEFQDRRKPPDPTVRPTIALATSAANVATDAGVGESPTTGDASDAVVADVQTPTATAPNAAVGARSSADGVTEQTVVATTMHLQVSSDPKGAEVFLGGKRLGVTPLSVFLPKRNGIATLTVRRSRFVEANTKVDLSETEVIKAFSMRRVAVDREARSSPSDPPENPRDEVLPCQRPDTANPFDETPICAQP